MGLEQATALVAMAIGAGMIAVGWITRHRGGRPYVFLGFAFVVGPLSPLLRGRVVDSARITCSIGALLLAGAAAFDAVRHRRRAR